MNHAVSKIQLEFEHNEIKSIKGMILKIGRLTGFSLDILSYRMHRWHPFLLEVTIIMGLI